MPDYIDREKYCKEQCLCNGKECTYWKCPIMNAPKADVEPVKYAHWLYTDAYPHRVYCSACHREFLPNMEWIGRYNIPTNRCPSCGAHMLDRE